LTSSALATASTIASATVRAALRNLIRCFAVEAGAGGVRVNAALPCVGNQSVDPLWAASVAEVIAFLCSPAARYMHGVVLLDHPSLALSTVNPKGRS
jgi:NAD(P)-dependent dehydrogenase (short-subunit alcohol dehydrogenase family)